MYYRKALELQAFLDMAEDGGEWSFSWEHFSEFFLVTCTLVANLLVNGTYRLKHFFWFMWFLCYKWQI